MATLSQQNVPHLEEIKALRARSEALNRQYGLGEYATTAGSTRTPTPPSADSARCTAPSCMAPDRGPR